MDKPLDMAGLATFLDVSETWVRERVAAREIPFTRLPGGRLVRFTARDIAEMFAAGHEAPLNNPTATTPIRRVS